MDNSNLEELYNLPGESWGEYFARLPHAYPVTTQTPVQNIRSAAKFQVEETKKTDD